MREIKFKKNLNIRPKKSDEGSIEALSLLAELEGRSLNDYIMRLLKDHINRNKRKINGR